MKQTITILLCQLNLTLKKKSKLLIFTRACNLSSVDNRVWFWIV